MENFDNSEVSKEILILINPYFSSFGQLCDRKSVSKYRPVVGETKDVILKQIGSERKFGNRERKCKLFIPSVATFETFKCL